MQQRVTCVRYDDIRASLGYDGSFLCCCLRAVGLSQRRRERWQKENCWDNNLFAVVCTSWFIVRNACAATLSRFVSLSLSRSCSTNSFCVRTSACVPFTIKFAVCVCVAQWLERQQSSLNTHTHARRTRLNAMRNIESKAHCFPSRVYPVQLSCAEDSRVCAPFSALHRFRRREGECLISRLMLITLYA